MNEETKTDNRQEFNSWYCETCQDKKEYNLDEILVHLKEVHGVDGKTTAASKYMGMHLDGRKWFQTNYDVRISNVRLTNVVRRKRAKNDPMGY